MTDKNLPRADMPPLSQAQIRIVGTVPIILYFPPPRAFVAVAGDLIQMFVVAAALLVPIIILLATVDIDHVANMGGQAMEYVTTRLGSMREQLHVALVRYVCIMFLLILTKAICTWFDSNHFAIWAIDRPLVSLTGGLIALEFIRSGNIFGVLKYVDFLSFSGRIWRVGK